MPSKTERRQHQRTHVLFSGTLVSGDQSVRGTVLDLSANGAKIRLDKPLRAPSAVTLRLARLVDFHVELVWSSGDMLGLKFREAPARIAAVFAAVLPEAAIAA
jgi:hypothetical protein